MKQEVLEQNEISVNFIYDQQAHYCGMNYFSRLDVFLITHSQIMHVWVRKLKRGKNRQLEFSETKQTKQMERKIEKYSKQFDKPTFIIQEETEQIFIYCQWSQKICTIQLEKKKNQSQIQSYEFSQENLRLKAFEKYLVGCSNYCFYIFRKNNFKYVLKQILDVSPDYRPQKFHLLQINIFMGYLLYRRSQFRLKIIRKIKNQNNIQYHSFNERYFTTYHNLSEKINIVDSIDMRIQQHYNLQNCLNCYPIRQLGLFFFTSDQILTKKELTCIKLEQNSLVYTIRSKNHIWHIKYSRSLGLLIFYNEFELKDFILDS